jgi:hypothetical protein
MSKIKKMEKGPATFMEPNLNSEDGFYHEVTVIKNYWKCLGCGRVWTTQHDARDCESRKHKGSYQLHYGGMWMNGRLVNARIYTIHCVRREPLEVKPIMLSERTKPFPLVEVRPQW